MSKRTMMSRCSLRGGGLARIGTAIAGTVAVAAAITMFGTPVASADTVANPSNYLVGNTVYFSYIGADCAMQSDGWVGCDLTGQTMNWAGFPVSNISIDLPFLPAHPAFGPLGTHGRAGSRTLDNPVYGTNTTLTYGGATCTTSNFRGEISCTSQGHNFNYGFSQGYS